MRRSVTWHFVLYSLAIIAMAIVAVGAVTLILVEANFSKQEEQYLLERGDQLVEPLQSALQSGSDPIDLQGIASLGLIAGHVRIRVLDANGRVLADSGSYDDLFVPDSLERGASPITALQLLLDESGRYLGVRSPAGLPWAIDPFMMAEWQTHFFEPLPFSAEPWPQPPIADISEAAVSLPLQVDSQVVGHAELSEGPAFGRAIRDTLQQALLIGGLAALVVAAFAALVAARQVTRPLISLGAAADQMARGDLKARAPGSNLSEIDRLATRFNGMADQLETTIASLESERASLRRFIADASHELRTPLTALKTFNTLLSADAIPKSGPAAELLRESGRQLDNLDQLTTDLLDLSRLEARMNGVALQAGDIRPAIEDAVSAILRLSQSKHQELTLNLPSMPIVAAHDPTMLQRAVQNLVSNAVKFSGQGRLVQVSVATTGATASIHVQDEGAGIPQSEQAYVFDRFYRGRSAAEDGSGLGLSIVREIVAIHGGTITFTSKEGAGSHFVLSLPLAST